MATRLAAQVWTDLPRRSLLAAVGVFAGVRVLSVLLLGLAGQMGHWTPVASVFYANDGVHYFTMLHWGYNTTGVHGEPLAALFPFYPITLGVLGISHLPPTAPEVVTAVAFSAVLSSVAAAGFFLLCWLLTHSSRISVVAVMLLAVLPGAIGFTMVLTEALFVALAVWCLIGLIVSLRLGPTGPRTLRWFAGASVLAMFAGWTRPTGVAVAAAVVAAAVLLLCQARRHRRSTASGAVRRGFSLAVVTWTCLGVSGFPGFLLSTWAMTGFTTTWFDAQRSWYAGPIRFHWLPVGFADILTLPQMSVLVAGSCALAVISWLAATVGTTTLAVWTYRRGRLPDTSTRIGWDVPSLALVAVFTVVAWATVTCAAVYPTMRIRLVVAVFTAVIPFAVWAARLPTRLLVALLGVGGVLSLTAGAAAVAVGAF